MLKKASEENDLDTFKDVGLGQVSNNSNKTDFLKAFFVYVKACPDATFAELDGAFRRQEMVYNLVAIVSVLTQFWTLFLTNQSQEKEIAPTQTIVDLQGNEGKKYTVTFQKGLSGRRARLAKDGRYPKDNEENIERLANAGFVKESFEIMCHNCGGNNPLVVIS